MFSDCFWGISLDEINPPGEYTKQKLGKQIAAAITGSSSCVTIPKYCLLQDSVFCKKQLACLHVDCQVNDGTMVDLKIRLSSLHLRMQLMCRIDLLDMSHTGKLSFRGHHVWSLTLFPSAFKFWLVLFFFFSEVTPLLKKYYIYIPINPTLYIPSFGISESLEDWGWKIMTSVKIRLRVLKWGDDTAA